MTNIRDMERGDVQQRGLITITVADSAWGPGRDAWHFSVNRADGTVQSLVWESPDVSLYHEDYAILSVVAARLWVGGKNCGALLADGRSFISISSGELWLPTPPPSLTVSTSADTPSS